MTEDGEDQRDLEIQGDFGPEGLARFIDEQVISKPAQVVTVDYPTRHPQLAQETVVPSTMEEIASMQDTAPDEPSWRSDEPTRRVIACFDSTEEGTGDRIILAAYKEFTKDPNGQPDGNYVRYVIRQCAVVGGRAEFFVYQWDMKGGKAVDVFASGGRVAPPLPEEETTLKQRQEELVTTFLESGGLYGPTGGTAHHGMNASLKIEEGGVNLRDAVAAHGSSTPMLEATTKVYAKPGRTIKGPTIVDQGPKMIDSGGTGGK